MPSLGGTAQNLIKNLLSLETPRIASVATPQPQEGIVIGPDGKQYPFQLQGDRTAANPLDPIPRGATNCGGQVSWISYAITHQLAQDGELLDACRVITKKRDLCAVMSVITMGAGYYMQCPRGGFADLKYGGTDVIYQLHVDTEGGKIFVAEKRGEQVLEVHDVHVGVRWFEQDHEDYERPVVRGDTACAETIPPPATAPPLAIIQANPQNGPEPLSVSFDGRKSYDPDGGEIVAYQWNFAGQRQSASATAQHMFQQEGDYNVSLTVRDDEGQTHTASTTITVNKAARQLMDPIAIIDANPTTGLAPLTVSFDGKRSYDPDGGDITSYFWNFAGEKYVEERAPTHTFSQPGTYTVSLTVSDDEDATNTTRTTISTITVPAATTPAAVDTCWMEILTLRNCGDGVDTLDLTPVRVICPAPKKPKIVYADCGCDLPAGEEAAPKRLQLAGGGIFNRTKMQLTEYGMGFTGQIRYRFGFNGGRKFAVLADAVIYPLRKATPLDDRPYKWSPLRDSIDVRTGLPLSWHRGTQRGTASLGLGLEFAPFPWLFVQGIGGTERTFQQIETSGPLKDDINQFVGFDLDVQFWSGRLGVRKDNLEIFFSVLASRENRPFVLIPQNDLGGSHNERWDKIFNGGVMILF
ncbi:MAG: PKD domain-containing protein [Bacteroidota bacterium]